MPLILTTERSQLFGKSLCTVHDTAKYMFMLLQRQLSNPLFWGTVCFFYSVLFSSAYSVHPFCFCSCLASKLLRTVHRRGCFRLAVGVESKLSFSSPAWFSPPPSVAAAIAAYRSLGVLLVSGLSVDGCNGLVPGAKQRRQAARHCH